MQQVHILDLGRYRFKQHTLALIEINHSNNMVSVDLTTLIAFFLLVIALFIAATFFFRGKRQRHLLYEKNMMSSLIDNIPDTIYFKDLDSKFTRVNKAQAKLLGFENPEDAIGKSDFDFFDHAQDAYDVEQQIIKTGIPVVNQIHVHTKDHVTRYLSDTKIPLTGPRGNCIGTVGITRDITDFKITEDAMLAHQAKFKALFDNAPLAIFRLDKQMRVVECNHRFRKMFGYDEDYDITTVTKFDLLVEPDLGELIIDTLMETKEVNTEIMLKRSNGESFIANLTLALLSEGFKETSIEGIVEDITMVAKARDEIIKAKDKAVEADNLKSLFLANMSHEIRTPMNAIIGFTNMLREDDLSTEDRNSFIDVIQSNGNSLMTLIDSIVDFSKLETDQMVVSISEFNFRPLFESLCDHASKLIATEEKSSKIKLIKTLPEQLEVRIKSDRHRLNQVLTHLISNAVKFTDEGQIELGFELDNKKINIFVRDTGTGIPKNKHRTIFERFAKVNSDKNKLYGGTGIGLTISKGLIKLMNGKIRVDSTPGKGSTFTVELKLDE
ncbi:PAS domain-containing sensor histidine kinase [Roseimarinus sediminis]|uniref:PAS domain-containing sensor histidine kinase n=1 Tax=Roseimarinus sediminis TaxID=1610899 RepID=UPI003D25B432